MNNKTTLELIENGYTIIDDCLDKKLIDSIKSNINNNLIAILKENNADHSNDLSKNYYQVKKLISQYKIQVLLAKKLVNEDLITKIFLSKKIFFFNLYQQMKIKEKVIGYFLIGPNLGKII